MHIAGDPPPEESGVIRQAKAVLLMEREKRVKPGRDEKILASWNGLILASLAEAASILDRKDYFKAAVANGLFLLNLMTTEGYLRHVFSHGQSKISGYLDDYALVVESLLNLHQVTFTGRWLKEAIRLAEVMVDEFWDDTPGLFYDTGKRHQALFVRPRSTHDGALPSGSSAATLVLLNVAHLTEDKRLEQIAARSLRGMRESLPGYPLGFGNWLCALDFYLSAKKEIVVVGRPGNKSTSEMMRVISGTWLPSKVFAALDPDDPTANTELKLLNSRGMVDSQTTAYICEGYSCQATVTNPDSLRTQLQKFGLYS